MPAPVSSSSAPHANLKATTTKPRAQPHSGSRKTRVVRRRGRAQGHFDSDEEIEREVGTDSESDEDDQSSVGSVSDSESEPASEDILSNGHSHILTPNTTQSSGDVISFHHQPSKPDIDHSGDPAPFFGTAGNWSEMVADENVNGPADLPVIDFASFDNHTVAQRSLTDPPSRKVRQRTKRPTVKRTVSASQEAEPTSEVVPPVDQHDESVDELPAASSSTPPPSRPSYARRPPGQSARQVYQQRLEADPSYVPTVGEFWGHDDRLLDKDLRSLSGWWRGRWQGRGRGRGGFVRGRGRGGYSAAVEQHPQQDIPDTQEEGTQATETLRVDQPWNHDGFEEMKRKDEQRRSEQQPLSRPTRGFSAFRGRGSFVAAPPRGRTTFGRGGFASSPNRQRTGLSSFVPSVGRTWFAMKPERVWTKQHEAFLYFDSALKPRPGQGPGYRVKLSTTGPQIIRGSISTVRHYLEQAPSSDAISEDGEKTFVVRIPKAAGKEKQVELTSTAEEPVTTVEEPPIDEIFTVRPGLVPRVPILDSQPPAPAVDAHVPDLSHSLLSAESSGQPVSVPSPHSVSPPNLVDQIFRETSTLLTQQPSYTAEEPEQRNTFPSVALDMGTEENSDKTQDAVLGEQRTLPPAPPPLQTVFPPVSQPSPPYGSPYGYGSAMPPGIAMNQHGMPYEMTTGRAVYLQPPTMYTPRPMTHGIMTPPGLPFIPGHMHHHSTGSPDFLAPPHTPPHNGFIDPATGMPIFSFPRQSTRIEIRQPSDQEGKQLSKSYERRPSGLRPSAADFEPTRAASPYETPIYFQGADSLSATEVHGSNDVDNNSAIPNGHASPEQAMDAGMMPYSPYQQQPYYYPYPQYYDMSHAQYEMYPTDPRASQAVYY